MLTIDRLPHETKEHFDALATARRRFRHHDEMWRHLTSLGSFWRALPELRAACRYLGEIIELEREWNRVYDAKNAALRELPALSDDPDTFWQ